MAHQLCQVEGTVYTVRGMSWCGHRICPTGVVYFCTLC